MGNVMCCCKGREKTLDEGKDESGLPSINKMKNSNKTPNGEESVISENSRLGPESGVRMGNEYGNSKISMANFNTFGGDNFIGVEEESIKPQASIMKPSRRGNASVKNNDTLLTESSKLSTKISTDTQQTKKSKIYLRIAVESLDIMYKNYDDFGLLFKPYLEIIIENQETLKVYTQATDDLDKSLNNSNISDTSMNLNLSQNIKTNNSISLLGHKEKSYGFKFSKCLEIPMKDFYTNIKFRIKNDFPSKNNSTSHSENMIPLITIGESKIPINLLYKSYKESSFDGNLEIKLRNSTFIGYLKVLISVSDNSLVEHDEFMDKMLKAKFLDVNEEDDNKILDNISGHSNKNSINIWDKNFINYDDLDPILLDKYFCIDYEKREEMFLLAKNIPQNIPGDNSNYDHKDLYKYFLEACKTQNLIALYQILILFVKITNKDDFKIVGEFFKLLNDNDKNNLVEFCKNCNDNPYIIKLYFIFFYNYMRFYKNNKSITIRNNKEIEDQAIIKNIIEMLGRLTVKDMNISSVLLEEIKDCIIWSLNLLNELVAQPVDLNTKLSKEELMVLKKKEYSVIYDNCILIVYKRMNILRLIDNYLSDSQMTGSIFRIFRKVIQVLTNDSTSLLDLSKLNIHPKEFSIKFRKLIIEQNDGIFFTTFKIILSKYFDYPELHVNILIIIYQLTNYCDSQSLICAAEKLDLARFKEVFDIYRGRLRNFTKLVNNLHLNTLANFSEISKNSIEESNEILIKLITYDIKSFYRVTANYKKRLDDFRVKKKIEFEIHDIITRVGVKITRFPSYSIILMDSFFFDDIIEFLIIIGVGESNDNESTNSNKSSNGADFILRMKEKKKKLNLEEIKKIVLSIVENSVKIIVNVMNCSNDISDPFSNKLAEHDIGSADDLFELIGECRNLLLKYGVDIKSLEECLEELKNLFE